MKTYKLITSATTFILLLFISPISMAKTILSYSQIWEKISSQSPEIKKTELESESAKLKLSRVKRATLPSAQLTIKAFNSNDAATNLFSNLGERSVSPSDFNPSTLNHPGYGNFANANLQINMPLYEGGQISAGKRAAYYQSLSKDYSNKFNKDFLFTNYATHYALLLSSTAYRSSIASLNAELLTFMKTYELNGANNPVGHSGELGLKALSNRLKGMSNQAMAEINYFKISLSEQAYLNPDQWSPKPEGLFSFLKMNLGSASKSNIPDKSPSSVKSIEYASKAMNESSKMEKSMTLPHTGIFRDRKSVV